MNPLKSMRANFHFNRALMQLSSARKAKSYKIESLYQRASESFASTVKADSSNYEAWHHWGLALYEMAQLKAKKDAKALYTLACEKFSAAHDIIKSQPQILNDWGAALMAQARSKPPKARNDLLQQAEEKFLAAEEMLSGIAAYNLACINSLRGNEQVCEKYLEIARDHAQLPEAELLDSDADLANIRDTKWFKRFIKGLD